MELFRNLFEGYPNLWGGGVAHSVLILSLVIAFGLTRFPACTARTLHLYPKSY